MTKVEIKCKVAGISGTENGIKLKLEIAPGDVTPDLWHMLSKSDVDIALDDKQATLDVDADDK